MRTDTRRQRAQSGFGNGRRKAVAIEQIRMGHMRVQVMWQHHAPDDAETPHLLLQPLLENAVFHGVESIHRPGIITVLTKLEKSSIFISIETRIHI